MVIMVWIASLVLLFVAAYFALRMIKLTGRSLAWSFITAAITLMALHCGVSLSHLLTDGAVKQPALSVEWITLAISALMAFGIWRITPIFIALRSNSERLRESETHYRTIFENSLISIWEEDFSAIRALFDRLRREGVSDIEEHFERHPEVVTQCADLAIIVEVNRAAVTLHGAVSKEELLAGLANTFTAGSLDTFRHELVCLWRGETEMTRDAVVRTLAGELRNVTVYFAVCPGYEGSLSKIFVSLIDITEHKQAEAALAASERQFRSLAESLPDYIARYDRQGRAVYCNSVLEKTLSATAADRIGRRIREYYTDGSYEAYAQAVDAVLAGGENSEYEFIFPGLDKEKIVYQLRMIAERDEHGEVSGVLAIGRDITELKRAEQERQAHTDFLANMDRVSRAIQGTNNLETMMSNVLDEVLDIFDCDRTFLLYPCDPAAASWSIPMERTSPEYPGAGALGVDIPMDREVAATLELLLERPGVLKFGSATDYPLPAGVAERFGVKSFMSTAIRPKVGNPWQFGVHQCSRERVWTLAEEQLLLAIGRRLADGLSSLLMLHDLLESEAKYRRIFDTASEGIWGQDENYATTFVNAHMAEMLGYARDELHGRLVTDFMFEEDIAGHEQRISNSKRSISEAYEQRFRRKDGRTLWTLISANPIFNDDGKFNGSFAMITDITELKQAEEALRSYSDNLEAKVQQRTIELRLARDAAEAASKAKSLFLAHMSHELRTPLNAILGFSYMMRQDPGLSTAQYQNLDIINQSGEHLLKLINDVLEIAKIEAGKLQLEHATFDLHALVREVSDMMRLRAQQKRLQMLLDLSSEIPRYIKGDEARLRQILVNLVGNAVKFTRQGGVTIRLGVKNDDRHHLLLEVEDTGPGIRIEDRQRLFKPFVQMLEGARHGGTGLGLSIVKQFVQLMGGVITLESTQGKGSLFRVELPLEMADEAEAARLGEVIHGEVTGLSPGQPAYRILIAEDQLDNQLLLATLMSDIGLEVKIAKNGEECVQLFTQWQPHLIWMDRRMPVMDGDEATRRIRQLPDGDKVKIVAVTASAFKEQQPKLRAAGMDDYVRKPFRISEIYDSLARELGVKYTYREKEPAASTASDTLTPRKLAAIAVDLRDELRDALETLDRERIRAAIDRIGAIDRELGRILSCLDDEFDYPAILEALETVAGGAGQSPAHGRESI